MSETDQTTQTERGSTVQTAARRGSDDRRSSVKPTDNPAPHSPAPDEETVRKGEDVLERVKPY